MAGIRRWKTAQYAERKWWQLYLRNKEVGNYLEWKQKYWQQLLSTCGHYFSVPPTATILDAGCGPAGIFMAFPNNQVTAIDPLLDAYETDLPHFKKENYPHTKFIQSSLEDFTTENKFDLIFCINAINHVQDIQKSFDKLVSYAESGAYIVVTIDAHTHTIFKKIFRFIPGDILHPHQFDVNEYQNMLLQRGCTIEGTELLKHTFLFDYYMVIAKKK